MDALESPMAGKVIEVKVKPGDAVADGDELIIIESVCGTKAVFLVCHFLLTTFLLA